MLPNVEYCSFFFFVRFLHLSFFAGAIDEGGHRVMHTRQIGASDTAPLAWDRLTMPASEQGEISGGVCTIVFTKPDVTRDLFNVQTPMGTCW